MAGKKRVNKKHIELDFADWRLVRQAQIAMLQRLELINKLKQSRVVGIACYTFLNLVLELYSDEELVELMKRVEQEYDELIKSLNVEE